MKRQPWQTCHYYADGRCPNQALIDRAYLIPQLLAPSELGAIETTCAACKLCRRNRKRHRRAPRPLDVAIFDERSGREVRGATLNVSKKGALIRVEEERGFQVNQKVHLRLYDQSGYCQSTRAVIMRLEGAMSAISVLLLGAL